MEREEERDEGRAREQGLSEVHMGQGKEEKQDHRKNRSGWCNTTRCGKARQKV